MRGSRQAPSRSTSSSTPTGRWTSRAPSPSRRRFCVRSRRWATTPGCSPSSAATTCPHAAEGGGLALWRVADPGNVGTLLRAADAFGAGYVALSAGCADPTGPKALRAAAGAIFRVAVVPFDAAPRPWTALATRDGTPIGDAELPREGTLVLGAEREGLPADVAASCEAVVSIPQAGDAESLNVAMAGTVGLYEWARRPVG